MNVIRPDDLPTSRDRPIDPDRWVDEHGDALYGYAMLRLRDADMAADVVQETFLQALQGRTTYRGDSSERTWLIGILKHKILDRFRGRANQLRGAGGEVEDQAGPSFFDEKQGWRIPPGRWGDLPEDVVERAEFWEVFRACLAELPTIYAETFSLAELEGLPGPEICEILKISPANLWARLHRARLMLRETLEARWFGRDDTRG